MDTVVVQQPQFSVVVQPSGNVLVTQEDRVQVLSVAGQGPAGPQGPPGPPGQDGANTATQDVWNYSTNPNIQDPGSGKFRTAGGTEIAISRYADTGTDRANLLRSLTEGDTIYLFEKTNADNWGRYKLINNPVEYPTWFKLDTEVIEAATAPTNNSKVLITFIQSSGFTPGGPDKAVQFNDAGVFGGIASFTYDPTSQTLTASYFQGDGSGLYNIPGSALPGTIAYTDQNNLFQVDQFVNGLVSATGRVEGNTLRSTGENDPTSGAGIEISFDPAGAGHIIAFDADTGQYKRLYIGHWTNAFFAPPAGNLNIGTGGVDTAASTYSLAVGKQSIFYSRAITDIPITVKGYSGQSASLQEWQDSGGVVRTSIDAAGNIVVNSSGTFSTLQLGPGIGTSLKISYYNNPIGNPSFNIHPQNLGVDFLVQNFRIIQSTTSQYFAQFMPTGNQLQSVSATGIPIIAIGSAGQSANLQEWRESSGLARVSVTKEGALLWNNGIGNTMRLGWQASNPSIPEFLNCPSIQVQPGWTITTADNSGTVMIGGYFGGRKGVKLGYGNITAGDYLYIEYATGRTGIGPTVSPLAQCHIINGQSTSTPAVIVQGVASQTGSLQEWQDSAGAVKLKVNADGSITPAHLADSAAANDTLYFSTTQGKLVFKDSSGVAQPLY